MKGEHFSEIRGVLATVLWLDPNIHLDYWSSACGHQKVFRLRMPYTKHYFGPKAINFWELVNSYIDVSPIWKSICRTTSPERRTPMPQAPLL